MTSVTPPTMNQIAYNNNSESHSPTSQKRQRAKQACEPCRLRKRRCDGDHPCNMCVKFEYKCYFEKHSRKRSKIVEKDAAENGITSPPTTLQHRDSGDGTSNLLDLPRLDRAAPEEMLKLRSMEANSGIAFTKFLGMRLDASAGPKLFTFGWNLGSTIPNQPIQRAVTDFLTLDQMLSMTKLYFENVHPLYGFIDRDWLMGQIVRRYAQAEQIASCPDHLLQGVAVLGSMFAPGVLDEAVPGLLEAAKLSLESTSMQQSPELCDVQAWLLRVVYLRFAGHPHTCWMASCITMHLVECLGLYQESNNATIFAALPEPKQSPEQIRRTFWVARLFNSWVSFENGRNRVALRGITCQLPESRDGDFTREYVHLYSISCCLDPELLDKPGQWEDFLQQLEAFEARHECITLSKANLALCAYRRLRLGNPNLPTDTINRIVQLTLGGLQAAKALAARRKPWWHTANVPFQTICVFLAIDSKESISHIAGAMRVLEFVADAFPSPSMKEALKTSRFLVRLSKRKKEQDSEVLAQSLLRDADECPDPQKLQPAPPQENGISQIPAVPLEEAPLTNSSGEEWNLDYLNNSEFDWNFFLGQDIPNFHQLDVM